MSNSIRVVDVGNRVGGCKLAKWSKMLRAEAGRSAATSCRECGNKMFRLRWSPRFFVRSLFIATTFLAVVIGMIAWLDRAWIGK
jgi:hypothetical protein